ncbi:flavin reductase family protein [Rhodococcus opacus]|uniref:flavin reductase family protein n=2 Tax=Rhodococcus opacus TaxID=37919 RepID=UPI001D016185|nr:flavin reductase family protein [Rhodococcus opacus]UDH01198.1 flavin reductase family protein [Rhodococcus opacus PD630]
MTTTAHRAVSEDFRTVLSHFPTGVAVLTGLGTDGPAGLTVQSFMALSLDPPMILVSVDRTSTSWPIIADTGRFAVNVMSKSQQDVALSFARSGGPKFDGVEWSSGTHTQAPLIADSQAWLECEIANTYDGGDHSIITAHVLALRACDDTRSHPLLFFRSKFPQLDKAHWETLCT